MSEIKLVCFDWGGVILRICRSWQEGCERAGLPVRDGSTDESAMHRRHELSIRYQIGELSCEAFVDALAETTDGLYTPDEIRLIHDAWLIEEYEGVGDVVSELVAHPSVSTGLLSNTNQLHWERHFETGNRPADFPTVGLLEHRHASHLLRLAKPDPAIYRAFERETGFDGPTILFFDDLEENVQAARSVGWKSEQIDHTNDTAGQIRAHLRTHDVL